MNIKKLLLLVTASASLAACPSANPVDAVDASTQEVDILTKLLNNEVELGSTITYKENEYVLSEISAYNALTAATLVKPVILLGQKIAEDIVFINLEQQISPDAGTEYKEYKESVSHERRYTKTYYELKEIMAGASILGITLILGQGFLSVLGKKIELDQAYLDCINK